MYPNQPMISSHRLKESCTVCRDLGLLLELNILAYRLRVALKISPNELPILHTSW